MTETQRNWVGALTASFDSGDLLVTFLQGLTGRERADLLVFSVASCTALIEELAAAHDLNPRELMQRFVLEQS